ncbi:MAG: leucine-rich repeat protein [Oscillospiraceae bacterium]|nr:leucine-rich repeat protein [Oscillospiraceae bacterium]
MKRIVSLFLSFIMVATLLPLNALAIELDEVVVEEPVEEITEPVYYEEDFAEQEAEKLGGRYSQTFEDWWKTQDKIPADRISFAYDEVFDETGAVEVRYDEASGCAIVRVKSADEESWKKIVAAAGTVPYNWISCDIDMPEGATGGFQQNTNGQDWILGFESRFPTVDSFEWINTGGNRRGIEFSENTVTSSGAVAISFITHYNDHYTCLAYDTPNGVVYDYLRIKVYIDCDESGILLPEGTVESASAVDESRIIPDTQNGAVTAYKNGELDYMPVSGRITYTYTGSETTIEEARNEIYNNSRYIRTTVTAPSGYVLKGTGETEAIIETYSYSSGSEYTINWVSASGNGKQIKETLLVEIDYGITTMDEQGLTPVPLSRLIFDTENVDILAKHGINVTYDETHGHFELTFDKDADLAAALAEGANITEVFEVEIVPPKNAVECGDNNSSRGDKYGWIISTNDRTWEEYWRYSTNYGVYFNGDRGLNAYNFGNKTLYSLAYEGFFDVMTMWWYDANGNLIGKEYLRVDIEPYSTVIEKEDRIEWNISEDGILTISGEGAIPDYEMVYDEYGNGVTSAPWGEYKDQITALVIEEGITKIGANAFNDFRNLTGNLVIPSTVTSIGGNAFRNCRNFTGDLVIPEGVKSIGNHAFLNCFNLGGKLVLPNSLTKIGAIAFGNCFGFEEVEVASGNQYFASIDDALYTKDGKTLLYYPGQKTGAYSINPGTETIGRMAFYHANVDSVTLPESVKVIEEKAFAHFDGKVTVKGKLDTIEGGAFGEYGDIISVYFMGGAPEYVSPADDYPSFTADSECEITLYYVDDGSWEFDANGLWNGYELTEIKVIDSGYCGAKGEEENLSWMITDDGTLTISGEGAIKDYTVAANTPWREYADIVTTLVLEEGITEIGSNAFREMVNLEGTLNLPEGLTRIGHFAFRGCSKLGGELVLPSTLKTVEQAAFEHGGYYTGTLVIPEGMENIGRSAFRDAGYTEVIIPASVNNIDGVPFIFNQNLEVITVDENNPYYCSVNGVLYNKDKTELIEFPQSITGKYTVLESVVTIRANAFCRTELDEIIVPANVKNIEGFGFGIDDIKIVFNGAPETFGNDVLAYGSGSIYFMGGAPKNVVPATDSYPSFSEDVALYYVDDGSWEFDENGLWNGYSLEEMIVYEQKLPTGAYIAKGYCGDELNGGKNLVWFINYSGTLTIRGKGNMADFEQVEDGNGVWKSTAPWVEYADKIKAITIEKGITSIGSYAFYELTNVGGNCIIPEGVTVIKTNAFNRTPFNGTLTLPSTLRTIGVGAFYECTGIKGALVIPEGVRIVKQMAFRNLAVTSISIPSTVENIESPAFFYCENLASYSVASGNENYCSEDGILFSKDKTVLIGYPSARTGTYTVPETVTKLATNCFSTTDLSKVIIPENVKTVGSSIFQKGKAEVVFEGAPETIEGNIFYGVDGKVYFLGGAPKEVVPANYENPSFNENVTIYYVDDGSWELDRGGRWNGYKVNAQYGFGDVNGDFEVNVKDVYYARLFAAKLFAPTELEFVSADVNGDGKINVIDANLIRKYVLKIIDKFPVEVSESGTYTLGMGIAPIISTSDGRAQADVTAAVVVLDDEGKIVSAQLDTVQTRINFPGGVLQNLNDVDLRSKYQKKDDFGMIVASPLGKEWFEQADAFEKAIVGMTAEDIENIPLVNNNGHMVADDETIYAGCTIDITSFQEAIIKACNDEYAKEFSASDLSLGIGNFTTLEGTTEATSYSEGIASFNTVFTGAVYDSEDKILACLIDNSWLKVGFDTEGAITSVPTDFRTRKEMKDDFGMIVASPIGKEWYEQMTAFENAIVGMTAKEVSEIKTINKNNHMVAEDETIYAVCTISIPAFQIGIVESRENLKFI